ncbi:MAG: type III-B CRISPR module-associated protein Cmr5 [Planctomycetaceae bacterium]|nr:type III-B CRISPR module-associated protein Cmr5 [Planctomycetaceae bacterium]
MSGAQLLTRDQKLAQKSFHVVKERIDNKRNDKNYNSKEYKSFAKSFPCLIHTCGLMQAIAFAWKDKKKKLVLEDFVEILSEIDEIDLTNCENFIEETSKLDTTRYMNRTRFAILAAGWLKRQVDALIQGERQ